jgi:hypothetical protein
VRESGAKKRLALAARNMLSNWHVRPYVEKDWVSTHRRLGAAMRFHAAKRKSQIGP